LKKKGGKKEKKISLFSTRKGKKGGSGRWEKRGKKREFSYFRGGERERKRRRDRGTDSTPTGKREEKREKRKKDSSYKLSPGEEKGEEGGRMPRGLFL